MMALEWSSLVLGGFVLLVFEVKSLYEARAVKLIKLLLTLLYISVSPLVPEWSTLIGPDPSRYSALIGGTLLCWCQGLCHNNTPQGK